MSWKRADGGQVCFISEGRAGAVQEFAERYHDDEGLIVAIDPDRRIVGAVALPVGLKPASVTQAFIGTALEGVLDLHTFGAVVGPLGAGGGGS